MSYVSQKNSYLPKKTYLQNKIIEVYFYKSCFRIYHRIHTLSYPASDVHCNIESTNSESGVLKLNTFLL